MEIFSPKNVIQKYRSAKIFFRPPQTRRQVSAHAHKVNVARQYNTERPTLDI